MTSASNKKEHIQAWWASNPMTYGDVHGQTQYQDGNYSLGTKEFFERLDQEFYSWNKPLHSQRPFDRLFPYNKYKNGKVLEIGCGLGTMLMNWALAGAQCTGVDLNPTSVDQTKKRFKLYNLSADIQFEDANHLSLPDNQFDYVYSWGVLHHSPNLEKSIRELFRVLKPGGGFGIMLYNRHSLYEWYIVNYIEGFLHNENQWLSARELNSRYGDGHREEGNPYTWPVTKKEGLSLLKPFSRDCNVRILGTDVECAVRLMLPGIGKYTPKFLIKSLARRLGWSLWFSGTKS